MSTTLKLETYLNKILDAYRTARAVYVDVNEKSDRLQADCAKAVRSGSLTAKGANQRKLDTKAAIDELHRDELLPAIQEAQGAFAEIRKTVDTVFSDLYRANPARLDMPTMELLRSGILTDQELLDLAAGFTGNNTMERVLASEARRRYDANPDNETLLSLAVKTMNTGATPAPLQAVDSLADLCNSALREDRLLADGVAAQLDGLAAEILGQYGEIAVTV